MWRYRGLQTGLAAMETASAERDLVLIETQVAALEPKNELLIREIETAHPGYLDSPATF